jgi:hypothetical protein
MRSLYRKNEFLKKFREKLNKHKLKRKLKKKEKTFNLKDVSKVITSPKILSIAQNPNETIKIFNEIKNHCIYSRKKILLNMANVEKVDVDSLIYLKYLVYKIRDTNKKNIQMFFEPPKNKEIKEYIYSSGFVTFIKRPFYLKKEREKSQKINTLESNKSTNFKIISGSNKDQEVLRQILEYTEEKIGNINGLYAIIHEMMENTILHAYEEGEKIGEKWYFFAEYIDEKVSFIFLDTGSGITKTAARKWRDYFLKKIDVVLNDTLTEDFILKTALKGEQRTRTKESHRGKGLPSIYERWEKGDIKNLRVISNKAGFNLKENQGLKESLEGTLFYWEMEKKNEENI